MTFSHLKHDQTIQLSTPELFEISHTISRDFAPKLSPAKPDAETKASTLSQELLNISEMISADFAPKITATTSHLMLLPIDPEHIHAYWHLIDDNESTTHHRNDASALNLRIYSSNPSLDNTDFRQWIDVPIETINSEPSFQCAIDHTYNAYCGSLGQQEADKNFIPVAHSKEMQFPITKTRVANSEDMSSLLAPQSSLPTLHVFNKSASGQHHNHS